MARAAKESYAVPVRFDRLTQAEYRILKLLDLGFSNQDIAERLGVAVGTVQWHLHQLFGKLQVPNRGKALALARDRGLV